MTGVTNGAGTGHPSGAYEFTPGFSVVYVRRSLVLCVLFCRSMSFFLFLLAIVLTVLLWFTDAMTTLVSSNSFYVR